MKNILKLEYAVMKDGEWTEEQEDEINDVLIEVCEERGYHLCGVSQICDEEGNPIKKVDSVK